MGYGFSERGCHREEKRAGTYGEDYRDGDGWEQEEGGV